MRPSIIAGEQADAASGASIMETCTDDALQQIGCSSVADHAVDPWTEAKPLAGEYRWQGPEQRRKTESGRKRSQQDVTCT